MKDLSLLVQNLGSDLRKMYPEDCQTMVLTNFCNIETESKMSKKKTRAVVPKATTGIKISKFEPVATTDSSGVSSERSCLRDLTCVTLKSVGKCFFENDGIGKDCNG